MKLSNLVLAAAVVGWPHSAESAPAYYRYPTLSRDTLVFASEGDLWRAPAQGGTAVRLTSHIEVESNPALSPDGRWVAFNGKYDGATEVYVMSVRGGAPRRLTFEGGGVSVRGWTREGRILFTSLNVPGAWTFVLRTVSRDGDVRTIPLHDANDGTYAEAGNILFFSRYGLALGNDNAVLYRGGYMAQLWRLNYGEPEATRLAPDFAAPIRHPMWWKGRVYFVSDKSGADNIWSVDADGRDPRQHTQFDGWLLTEPQLTDGRIVYQRGADIYRYDIGANRETKLRLETVSDRDHQRVRWLESPLKYLERGHMSADGKSVALTARSNIAVAFTGDRRRVELDLDAGVRARSGALGPKGVWVYAVIGRDDRSEIWRYRANGLGRGERIAASDDAHIFSVYPSPKGDRILFDDKLGRLWSLDVKSRRKTLLEKDLGGGNDVPYEHVAWSGDGRHVAYRVYDARSIQRIVLRDLKSGRREAVTTAKYGSYGPAFSSDGKWLYFISDRNFKPSPRSPWGDRNPGPSFPDRGRIYALQLEPGAQFPFVVPHELDPKKPDVAGKDGTDKKKKKDQATAKVQFDGVAGRLWSVPVSPGHFRRLAANKSFLYVLQDAGDKAQLASIKIDPLKPKKETFAKGVTSFELSADGETLYVQTKAKTGASMSLLPAKAKAPSDAGKYRIRVGDWRLAVDPRAEWRQMFFDAWRLHRDFAYDRKLRNLDWPAIRDKYQPLVERVGHRTELADVLAQMVAELGILHSQVSAGDVPVDPEGGTAAFLGAEFEPARNGLRIAKMYDGERDLPETLGPMLHPSVDIRPRDVVTAINGLAVRSIEDLSTALLHKAGQQVRLELTRKGKAFAAIVTPVDARRRRRLMYQDWVQTNRDRVARVTDGQVGYLHLAAMGSRDIASFVRDFYEHYDKDGVILDVRDNGGGNVDSWIIGNLLRRPWAFWMSPIGGRPYTNPQQSFRGHLVVLINQGTYSDGETFSAGVKALQLAPLIGTRTSGAGIWLSDRNPLADGGRARVAEYAQYGLDGRWLIEGRGVSPDVEVDNPPRASFGGRDAQLDAAVEYLQKKLEQAPIPALAPRPLPPVGTPAQDVR